jgi:hypothetical protein
VANSLQKRVPRGTPLRDGQPAVSFDTIEAGVGS